MKAFTPPRKTLARFFAPLLSVLALGAATAAQARPVMCGDTLYQSITLAADVVCGPGEDGLTIGDHNVRIHLNGFSIRGTSDPGTTGIRSYRFDAVEIIGPGNVEGFESSVYLQDGDWHRVTDTTVRSGNVTLNNSSGSTVDHNTLSSLNLLSMFGGQTSANHVTNNVFTPDTVYPANAYDMIRLYGCGTTRNVVAYNDQPWAPNPNWGGSIAVADGPYENEISRNTLTRRLYVGQGAAYNFVSGNVITMDPAVPAAGVWLATGVSSCAGGAPSAPIKNTFVDNEIHGGPYGFMTWHNPSGPKVADNHFHRNRIVKPTRAGILFNIGSQDNDATNNRVVGTIPYAIDHGTGNLWP